MKQELIAIQKNKLPEGWHVYKMEDVCDLKTGGTPSKSQPEYFGGNIKWIVSGDVNKEFIYDVEGHITELGLKNSNARMLPIDSVLIALNGQGKTRGTVAVLKTEATCNQSIVAFIPKNREQLNYIFLYYYLKSGYQKLRNLTGDNERSGLSMRVLRQLPVVVPPIDTQRMIINKLDKQMAQIEMMKKEAEKQRDRVNNLMNSYLNELYQKYSISITSFEKYIVGSSNGYGERPKGVEEGPIVLRIADVSSGQVDYSNARRGNVAPEMQLKYKLNSDDLIFIRVNGSRDFVGRCILFNNEIDEPVLFNDHLIRVQVNDEFIPGFVKIWCETPFIRRYMADTASTSAGQLTINRSVLNEMPIPKIDKSTQKRIIEYYKRLHSEYSNLKKMIDYQLNAINHLPASMLNEVFGQYQINS